MAFIPKEEGKDIINHKDGNPFNNDVKNLEWCTQRENVIHANNTGLRRIVKYNREQIKRDYDNGVSVRKIAEQYGVSKASIYRFMRKSGIKRRSTAESLSKYNIDLEVLRKELKHYSVKELAKKYKCSPNLISVRKYRFKKEMMI